MKLRHPGPVFASALLAFWVARPCAAQGGDRAEQAASHFDAGLSLYQQGRMRDAAVEFLTAFDLAPHGDAMFNAGLALDAAGDSAGAATAFAWALELGMRAHAAPEAKTRLARLAPRLGTLRVLAPEDSTVEVPPLKRKGAPVVFYALPGEILVTVSHADGALVSRRVRARAGAETLVDLGGGPPRPAAPPPARPAPQAERDASAAKPFPWPTLGWIALGTGAAAGVGAVLLRSATLSAKDDFDASGHTDADARERALELNRWTNVALVTAVAAGAAGGGILLFYRDPKRQVGLAPAPAGVKLFGRF